MTPIERLKVLIGDERGKQKELASAIDVPTSTLNNWFNRNTDIPSSKIIPICEFMDITVYFLLTGKENRQDFSSNEEERILLERYRSLDKDGQDVVRVSALKEWRRMEQLKTSDVSQKLVKPPPTSGRDETVVCADPAPPAGVKKLEPKQKKAL